MCTSSPGAIHSQWVADEGCQCQTPCHNVGHSKGLSQLQSSLKNWLGPHLKSPWVSFSSVSPCLPPFFTAVSPQKNLNNTTLHLRVSPQGIQSEIAPYFAFFKWIFSRPFPLPLLSLGLSCVDRVRTQQDSNCCNISCLWGPIWWSINICWMNLCWMGESEEFVKVINSLLFHGCWWGRLRNSNSRWSKWCPWIFHRSSNFEC